MKSEQSTDGEDRAGGADLRVGLVARDPLRILGLQTMLEGAVLGDASVGTARRATLVPLTLPKVLEDAWLSVVMIDAGCTEHLFELLETFRRMRPQIRMIVIGDSNGQDYVQRVIGAGAKGYLTHAAGESEVRMALEIVSDGSVWAPRKVLARLLDGAGESDAADVRAGARFTVREVQVLRYLVGGMANREIAGALEIDESTVKAHLSRLMRKVGAKNRVELTVQALKQDFTREAGTT